MTDKRLERQTQHEVLPLMKTRFSARAMNGKALQKDTLHALIEAAGLAPSCFNEQPWRFLVAEGERFDRLLSTLTEKNQSWAKKAGALILLMSKKTFTQGGHKNPWHLSDAGCAAGFLMLEAERRGLYAHPMAGFNRDKARELFQIDEDLEIIEVIAVGEPGNKDELPEALREAEHPQARKPYTDLIL